MNWKSCKEFMWSKGQVMAVYGSTQTVTNGTVTTNKLQLRERHIYGASRLGMVQSTIDLLSVSVTQNVINHEVGTYRYEITNWLGNVNAVVSDRKKLNPLASSVEFGSYYSAVIFTKADYYPFGMTMPGRTQDLDKYRYAYNGMESDNETKGTGNHYNYGARQYDPRLGRWMSLDPLKTMYPSMSPYNYAADNPVGALDPDGNYVIYVNGFIHGAPFISDDILPGKPYWQEGKYYNPLTKKMELDKMRYLLSASEYFGDHGAMYVNGSGDGITSTASSRYEAGQEYAKQHLAEIKSNLAPGETIKFLTHSMGAAYAEGMISIFMEDEDLKNRIEKVVHLSPADAGTISIAPTSTDIQRVQLNVTMDNTLDAKADRISGQQRIKGVQTYGYAEFNIGLFHPGRPSRLYPSNYNAHQDTKANANIFGVLKDLESLSVQSTGLRRVNGNSARNVYFVNRGSMGIQFNSLFLNGRFLQRDGKYSKGSDKYLGPEYDCSDCGDSIPVDKGKS